jgi:glycerol-3-phosphate acyltransferase PlsY
MPSLIFVEHITKGANANHCTMVIMEVVQFKGCLEQLDIATKLITFGAQVIGHVFPSFLCFNLCFHVAYIVTCLFYFWIYFCLLVPCKWSQCVP